jgi:hypothetical protein
LGVLLAGAGPASAQLRLPGAVAPAPVGSNGAPARPGPAHPAAPPPLRAPSVDSVVGRELRLNGEAGLIAIERADKDLRISQLSLPGNQISRPADICRVDIGGAPVSLRTAPRDNGLLRYDAEVGACPLTIDVLEGALKVSTPAGQCVFRNADCTVTPGGVWGPPGASFSANDARTLEKARAVAESNARSYYRALIAKTKDRNEVKAIAADQAGFSSRREEMCRDYAGEEKHGFCAARITEAHALALRARLYPNADDKPPPARTRKGPAPRKPTPVAPALLQPAR